MLSVLPSLLFLSPFSAFLIRIALALTLGFSAWNHFSDSSRIFWIAGAEIVATVGILIGAWTQVGALIGALIVCVWLVFPQTRYVSRGAALLALVLCLSLIMTGAGAVAFDLPL